ncbi:iron-regulated protein A precursor [Adhaeribacter aerolatus]|uniref:Iron-regulated protein A n=1 Tax=Adhaeribacter aerolatus TaxID=670289 RepID=A0A512B0Y3_9BACT|nr:imelysin family protein [Adhaeribacter aerolatus]GEO05457.1 iron-regulated protein A precursor [Adhaeribacter aerolatus]
MLFVIACSEGDKTEAVPDNGFDKTAMLTNYADNLIIPAYAGMEQKLAALESAVNTFLATPTTETQQALKPIFKEAYLQFQRISVYQLGPAETLLLNNFLNTFPADAALIENNISNNTYNLEVNAATKQQGFPALDYLLFSDQALQKLDQPTGPNRKKYVQDILARMKALVNTVHANWNNTYRAQFIANTRADVGSPIGFLVNQFAYELDQLKGPRIGWPYGKQSGGTLFPEKSEAYYGGFSGSLAVENLTSLKKAYTGNESGKGISDYLIALKKEQLNTDVLRQFDLTIDKLKAIPDPLAASFTSHKDLVDAAYREVQNLLTLMKTDVASATGVRITYQDSDGD